jgi:cysteine synthase
MSTIRLSTLMNVRTDVCPSILDTIGQPPLVALDRLAEGLEGRLLAKIGFFSPGLSTKDRASQRVTPTAAIRMLQAP